MYKRKLNQKTQTLIMNSKDFLVNKIIVIECLFATFVLRTLFFYKRGFFVNCWFTEK